MAVAGAPGAGAAPQIPAREPPRAALALGRAEILQYEILPRAGPKFVPKLDRCCQQSGCETPAQKDEQGPKGQKAPKPHSYARDYSEWDIYNPELAAASRRNLQLEKRHPDKTQN
eukprot:SM000166S02484  [mRNA]  locus=s166:60403:60906:- [translate_table: standard]